MTQRPKVSPDQRHSNDRGAARRGPKIAGIAGIAAILAIAAVAGWALTRTGAPDAPSMSTDAPSTSVTPNHVAETEAGVARIDAVQLKDLVDRDAVTLIDVRDSAAYASGHIPGALHIPLSRIELESSNLPGTKAIVTYCT